MLDVSTVHKYITNQLITDTGMESTTRRSMQRYVCCSAAVARSLLHLLINMIVQIWHMVPAVYSSVLLQMINYLDGVSHLKWCEVPRDRIVLLTLGDLIQWFNFQVFGTETPVENENHLSQSTSVEFWKKSLSFFMDNWLMAWYELLNVGNSTGSQELNNLVKYIKKKEVRKQCNSSKARGVLLHKEFKSIIATVQDHTQTAEGASTDPIWNFGVPSSMSLNSIWLQG